jgi:hypothetical protein
VSRRSIRSTLTVAVAGVALALGASIAVPLAGASALRHDVVVTPTIGDLSQIAFDSAGVGYGLFVTGGGVCRTYVAKTTDAGAKFSALVHLNGCDSSIAADAHGDVFVYGKQLLVSHNDGASFTALSSFDDVDQVVTFGDSVWLARAVCSTKTAVSCPLRLYVSANGGVSWTLSVHQPSGAVGWAAGGGGTYLVLVDATIGFVLSHPPNSNKSSPLYFTNNGGQSWTTRSLPCPSGVGGYFNATASPHGAFWAACAGKPEKAVQLKSVEVSTNEGASWKKGATCRSTGALLCQGTLEGIAAISWHSAWVTSQHGDLLVTHDSGKSWASVSSIGDAAGGSSAVQVQFFNEKVGVATGTAPSGHPVLMWWTDNGGTTWTVTRPSL